jgi:hypothetical protein
MKNLILILHGKQNRIHEGLGKFKLHGIEYRNEGGEDQGQGT